ncbi:MAG TPA: SurA N-terminal domain-containing protein, partial [Candidatus Methanoperedens sp.]|nr:SurA N-terminal domain-containing protein [Candidatus Methanoperedens sp.]
MGERMYWGTAAAAAAIIVLGSVCPAAAAAPAPAAAAAPVAGGEAAPIARVNGVVITRGEFERNLAFVLQGGAAPEGPDAADAAGDVAAPGAVEVRGQVLDRLVDEELLHQEARKRNFLAADADVAAEITEARSQFESQEAFAAALAKSKLTEEGLRAIIARNLSIQNFVEKGVAAAVAVPEAEVHAFYAGNAESFAIPEQVRARHI